MRVIGITGGVGAGKSTVLSVLETEYGAAVLPADEIGRELMAPGGACFEPVLALFGREVLLPDGCLDRKKIAGRVFQDKNALEQLNRIVHPAVRKEIGRRLGELLWNGCPVAAVESAILLEAGYREICDEVWYIHTDKEIRIRRLSASRGYTREKCLEVMGNQLSEEEFKRHSDVVIENNGGPEEIKMQIAGILPVW